MTNNLYRPPKTDRRCTIPSTLLQRIQQQSNFAIKFRLQEFHISQLRELKLSAETRTAVLTYNAAVEDLQNLIHDDWETHRAELKLIKAADKLFKEDMEEIDIPPF